MPILWRHLFFSYFKVLCFAVFSFIAILLTTRLQEIAQFAALGAQGLTVLWFALYQIPYILPIAIPISSLISAMILMQRLSVTQELTALRAAGISMRGIFTPIILMATVLALLNFYIVSEAATNSHLKSRVLEQEMRSVNPLLLLENQQITKLKGIYVQSMGSSRLGESASDVIVGLVNKKNHRISLMLAKKLVNGTTALKGSGVTLINSLSPKTRENFDHLLLENMESTAIPTQDFSHMLKKQSGKRIHSDYLKMSLLLMRAKEDRTALKENRVSISQHQQNFLSRRIARAHSEVLRRISIAVAVVTFTLLGIAYGISISRHNNYFGIIWVVCLTTLYLLSYFFAKGIDDTFYAAAALYLIPHVVIIYFSLKNLKKISRGIE